MTSLPPEEPLADPMTEAAEDRIAVDVPDDSPPNDEDKLEGY